MFSDVSTSALCFYLKMSKPSDKSKQQVRFRRERNLVAKHNYHKGGYHTAPKYIRRKPSLVSAPMSQAEINDYWELTV